ncbi:Uncharacterised protein [[Clostridium] sordellii]|uniref:PH domain-containing protein n=1 Tax=Paraclostridium sordellii TaxID=1505 RepID=UPI000543756F|nr:PH domain-containing protein [Paeniclostridium sordellii]MDU5021979.1 PH domain-containing protein [Clostridiales bacterium]AUN14112.1 hypothetical protein RSJ16_07715 [Paeniclostridium sordellii]MBS6022855.1 PH domain-containing protein [Paeniclostridium sordellii]CEK34128.1 hypothetical protein UMC2_13781 [[Clostridium] sordellii] [Paeniclostridium sordellii]CEQ08605.1 Uncharacterised protein [[Clostridium] sordellii] [Paeniclostridium sordellii]
MNLKFKATLQKEWILLDDKIIYGGREILLTDIESVDLMFKSSVGSNGLINIVANGKKVRLIYPDKSKENAEKALVYLLDNCGTEEEKLKYKKKLEYKRSTQDVKDEINTLPYKSVWGTRKEVSELPTILGEDEHIKAITSGLTDGKTWLIVCTTKRVLMLDRGMIGLTLIDTPLDKINTITHTKGLLFGKILITDGATTRAIENIPNKTISFFADTVNNEVEVYTRSKNTFTTQVVNDVSPADELIKYKQLLDMGALTEEEFDIKKKEILGL